MDDLLQVLFAAAVELSGLPEMAERPAVDALPHAEMMRAVCAELKPPAKAWALPEQLVPVQLADHALSPLATKRYDTCLAQRGLVAAYLPGQFRIVHRESLDLADDADNSFIVHEFVHALQEHQQGERLFDTCSHVLANEREAYAVQQQYLRSRGQLLRVGERLRLVTCENIL